MSNLKFFFFFFLFFFLIINPSYSLKVAPASVFVEGEIGDVFNTAFSFGDVEEILVLELEGDFVDSVSLDNYEFPCNNSCMVDVSLVIPDLSDSPGRNVVVVYGMSKQKESFGGGAIAVPRIGARLIVDIPYPNKFLSIDKIHDYNSGERFLTGDDLKYVVEFTNRGSYDISEISALLKIRNLDNDDFFYSDIFDYNNLITGQTSSINILMTLSEDFPIGFYEGVIEIDYGAEEKTIMSINSFLIGDQIVETSSISPKEFESVISLLSLRFTNYWVNELNCFAIVNLLNGSQSLSTSTSKSFLIDNLVHKEEVYLDLTMVPVGDYSLSVDTDCEGIITKSNFNISIIEQESIMDNNPEVIFDNSSIVGLPINLVISSIILLVLISLVFFYIKKKKQSDKSDEFDDGFDDF